MAAVKAILFDLGGVLIDFVGLAEVRKLMREDPGPELIRARWMTSRSVGGFERGALSQEAFAATFIEEWGLDMAPGDFIETCRSWIRGPLPGAAALLDGLRPDFTLACLSNTNELHWELMLNETGLGARLDRHFASHLIGKLKPEPDIFLFACDQLGLPPQEVLFFDDGDENVQGARSAGLEAHRVEGPAAVEAKLVALGLGSGR